jgi:hypothetical protein
MDFEGKVMEILPAVTGQSARGTWERQTVVFEQPNKQYGKEIAVTFMNKGQEVANLRVGENYIVSFDIESRNYQGKWYTDVRAWRVQPVQAASAASAMPADMPPFMEEPQPSYSTGAAAGVVDDMPF